MKRPVSISVRFLDFSPIEYIAITANRLVTDRAWCRIAFHLSFLAAYQL